MWVKKVRIFSRIPQLPMKASIHIHLSSVVSSIEHSRVVTDPIQVSVKHLHNVAFATRLRVIEQSKKDRESDHRNDRFLANQFRWRRHLCSACR